MRVDHVMGLFRLFWIPRGTTPSRGAYVRYPGHELLDILCIESERAGAVVIGEDLGTVEDEVRAALHAAGVLSYRVAWFEDQPPETYPRQALATVTTHDLPTVAGAWSGADAAELRSLGRDDDAKAVERLRRRFEVLGVASEHDVCDVVTGIHRRLAAAPSMLVAATLEDVAGVEERPNVPGTTDERPNWSTALPARIDDVLDSPVARATAEAFRAAGRARPDPSAD
jgi:4-alpha-glucanotransferase